MSVLKDVAADFETLCLDGSFGDKKVLVHLIRPAEGWNGGLMVVFHGVHGTALPDPGNKYGDLGRLIASRGAVAAVVETSRLRRDRGSFGSDKNRWAREAFTGKTFAQEMEDLSRAVRGALETVDPKWLWLWGFSLGGIGAMLLASGASRMLGVEPPVDRVMGVVTSGTGDTLRDNADLGMLELPILNSLPDRSVLHEGAKGLNSSYFAAFRGTEDDLFSVGSCRRLVDLVPLSEENKFLQEIPGVDHSFRTVNGEPSREPLKMMVDRVRLWWP
ncbi:dienelactone hydrolase-like enzyme [Thermanaerovibrio velox DSM 12556]|uniref:Dienelactone hydrolase-like enzyme n=1 Tax=Thermanaerovibrio velox DSM 12556 TaxID=926567 RepID=H0UNQ8_9BACT|nr:alpha/beta hydrolase [Thermanaerovibrio velox]EHM10473.1 dienelactone hydrolase-like enzyme [Thermanaerovibrio velox DSM 12556]